MQPFLPTPQAGRIVAATWSYVPSQKKRTEPILPPYEVRAWTT
jgi:hypothetical protein